MTLLTRKITFLTEQHRDDNGSNYCKGKKHQADMNNARSSNRKAEQTITKDSENGDSEEQIKSFRKRLEPKVSGLQGEGTASGSSCSSLVPHGAESDVIDTIRILIIAMEITLPIRQSR